MDDMEKQYIELKFAELNRRLDQLHPSGLTSKSFWTRTFTVLGYQLLVSIIVGGVIFLVFFLLGLSGY